MAQFLDGRIGRDASVLVEQDGIGRTEHYAPIVCESVLPNGSMAVVRVTGRDGAQLTGRLAA